MAPVSGSGPGTTTPAPMGPAAAPPAAPATPAKIEVGEGVALGNTISIVEGSNEADQNSFKLQLNIPLKYRFGGDLDYLALRATFSASHRFGNYDPQHYTPLVFLDPNGACDPAGNCDTITTQPENVVLANNGVGLDLGPEFTTAPRHTVSVSINPHLDLGVEGYAVEGAGTSWSTQPGITRYHGLQVVAGGGARASLNVGPVSFDANWTSTATIGGLTLNPPDDEGNYATVNGNGRLSTNNGNHTITGGVTVWEKVEIKQVTAAEIEEAKRALDAQVRGMTPTDCGLEPTVVYSQKAFFTDKDKKTHSLTRILPGADEYPIYNLRGSDGTNISYGSIEDLAKALEARGAGCVSTIINTPQDAAAKIAKDIEDALKQNPSCKYSGVEVKLSQKPKFPENQDDGTGNVIPGIEWNPLPGFSDWYYALDGIEKDGPQIPGNLKIKDGLRHQNQAEFLATEGKCH